MTTIHLQGIQKPIKDCETLISQFCETDGSYQSYDLITVPQDNVLRETEIHLANTMVARMSNDIIRKIVNRSDLVGRALGRISPNVTILDADAKIPWSSLRALFDSILMPGVRAARATKILHKKRPNTIPILDSVVQKYARSILQSEEADFRRSNEPECMVKYCRILKNDVDQNREALKTLARKFNLSIPRILDILIWSASGTYTPVWARRKSER